MRMRCGFLCEEELSLRRLVGRRAGVARGGESEEEGEEGAEVEVEAGYRSSSESEGGRMVIAIVVEELGLVMFTFCDLF